MNLIYFRLGASGASGAKGARGTSGEIGARETR
jgi:hypothetical protein